MVTSADGTKIAYEQVGAGPALVMVDPAMGFHGFRPMGPVIPLLAERFTVVTYDRRGRGDSGDTCRARWTARWRTWPSPAAPHNDHSRRA